MKISKVIFNLFLAFSIVIFSCGITIGKMVCLNSGDVSVELFNIEDCCGEPEQNVTIEEECCDISNSTYSLSAFTFTKYLPDFSTAFLNTAFLPEIFSFDLPQLIFTPNFSLEKPPPLYGKELLYSIRILII